MTGTVITVALPGRSPWPAGKTCPPGAVPARFFRDRAPRSGHLVLARVAQGDALGPPAFPAALECRSSHKEEENADSNIGGWSASGRSRHAAARGRACLPDAGRREGQVGAASGAAGELPAQQVGPSYRREGLSREQAPARDHAASGLLREPERTRHVQAVRALPASATVVRLARACVRKQEARRPSGRRAALVRPRMCG